MASVFIGDIEILDDSTITEHDFVGLFADMMKNELVFNKESAVKYKSRASITRGAKRRANDDLAMFHAGMATAFAKAGMIAKAIYENDTRILERIFKDKMENQS